jgi:signal transduction histidine kinase
MEDQGKLFNSFYRTEVATRRGIAGTGLGLYLSRVIIESHGGHIWVESNGKRGSTFSFSLPRVS